MYSPDFSHVFVMVLLWENFFKHEKNVSVVILFVAEAGSDEVTPLIEGPLDTSEMYTANLFRSTQLQENIVESTGPVMSFTLQVPQAAVRSGEPVTQPGEFYINCY